MNFPTSVLVVVQLMTTLCVITWSEEVSLTCPDTARRQLTDISKIFNCTPSFVPEEEVAICDGVVTKDYGDCSVTLTFKMLEEAPEGTATCVSLRNLFVNVESKYNDVLYYTATRYSFDFNPLLAVGILTASHNTSNTNRSCSISLLSDVLNLTILSQFNTWDSSFWNFSSPLLGTQLNWIQNLSIDSLGKPMQLIWLERLQNTSIQLLNVTNMMHQNNETILLKNMPVLRQIIFDTVLVEAFHKDSFLGMPEMEVLILQQTDLHGVPEMIDRMPKLKILKISDGSQKPNFTLPTKELSTLRNLQVLNLKFNTIYSISGRLPPFSKLRKLNLGACHLSSIEESDFVGYPMLEDLSLSNNMLTNLKYNTFRPLKNLKLLDLSSNSLSKWPELYDFSFIILDMTYNLLWDVYNLGNTRTRVEFLKIAFNEISQWDDKYVFSLQKSLISNDDLHNKVNMSHSENSDKKIPVNLSLVNACDQTELFKSDNSAKVTANDFENVNLMQPRFWVKKIDISHNMISHLSEAMIQSLDGICEVDLGGNEFDCVDCRMIPFQKWLNTTSTTVKNSGTSDPLLCSSPLGQIGTPVNLVKYDEKPCLEKIRSASLLTLIGVPVGVVSTLAVAAAGGIYKFRSEIGYMLHLYKIRRRAKAFSQSVFNRYAFDAFICYSCKDRRFVLTRLASLLEKGQEHYCLCLHERDFPLGSHIVSNIVGSIQHSRKTIIVLSEHFIDSKWCKWELEMANHKMFNEDEDFLILIQLDKLDRNKLPRHLLFLMDTRTYLEWPPVGHKIEEQVVQRLKSALGPSIFQKTNERAPLLSEVMEQY